LLLRLVSTLLLLLLLLLCENTYLTDIQSSSSSNVFYCIERLELFSDLSISDFFLSLYFFDLVFIVSTLKAFAACLYLLLAPGQSQELNRGSGRCDSQKINMYKDKDTDMNAKSAAEEACQPQPTLDR